MQVKKNRLGFIELEMGLLLPVMLALLLLGVTVHIALINKGRMEDQVLLWMHSLREPAYTVRSNGESLQFIPNSQYLSTVTNPVSDNPTSLGGLFSRLQEELHVWGELCVATAVYSISSDGSRKKLEGNRMGACSEAPSVDELVQSESEGCGVAPSNIDQERLGLPSRSCIAVYASMVPPKDNFWEWIEEQGLSTKVRVSRVGALRRST